MPEVSVIIPSYNHGRYLRKRLDSVFQQTFQDFEVILLDDCSSDNSREILAEYSNDSRVTQFLCNQKNSGTPFGQWEKGINIARGKWIWIAESDDESDPLFLERLVALGEQHENVGIAFCRSNWIDSDSQMGEDLSLYFEEFLKIGRDEIRLELWKHCTIPNVSSAIIRRDSAVKAIAGLWKFKACGDWMFYIRVLHTTNLVYSNEKLNHFRWYHQSTSKRAQVLGLWVTEGSRLLHEIRHRDIAFSSAEMLVIVDFWMAKCKTVKPEKRFTVWWAVCWFIIRWSCRRGLSLAVFKTFVSGTLKNLRRAKSG